MGGREGDSPSLVDHARPFHVFDAEDEVGEGWTEVDDDPREVGESKGGLGVEAEERDAGAEVQDSGYVVRRRIRCIRVGKDPHWRNIEREGEGAWESHEVGVEGDGREEACLPGPEVKVDL